MLLRLRAPLAPLDLNAAAASPEARTPCPYRKAAARASAHGRHASGIAGHWQRDSSRCITRSIRYTEQLWACEAGAGGASTTYLPAPAAVALAALLQLWPLSRLDTYADSLPNPPPIIKIYELAESSPSVSFHGGNCCLEILVMKQRSLL